MSISLTNYNSWWLNDSAFGYNMNSELLYNLANSYYSDTTYISPHVYFIIFPGINTQRTLSYMFPRGSDYW